MSKSVVIVTGASSGIGKATALRLATSFGAVVLAARSGERLQEVGDQARAAGADVLTLEIDLSDPGSATKVVEQTLATFGRIDALVNVAGAVPGLDVFEMTDEQWDGGLALKFHGARRLTLRAWDALKASEGSVVFISGNAAEMPKAASAAVASINAAIEALAKAFSERGVTDGVQVNTVSPGAVLTSRRMGMIEKVAKARGVTVEDAKKAFLTQAGITRFGTPEEIAYLVAFAVSAPARWMTGTVLRMDGGEIKSI